jgi:hypothetical protein
MHVLQSTFAYSFTSKGILHDFAYFDSKRQSSRLTLNDSLLVGGHACKEFSSDSDWSCAGVTQDLNFAAPPSQGIGFLGDLWDEAGSKIH